MIHLIKGLIGISLTIVVANLIALGDRKVKLNIQTRTKQQWKENEKKQKLKWDETKIKKSKEKKE